MLMTLETNNGCRDIDIPYEAMEDPILMNKIIDVLLEEDDEDEYDDLDYDELFFSESDEEDNDDEYEDEDDDGDMFPNGEDDKEAFLEYWMNH